MSRQLRACWSRALLPALRRAPPGAAALAEDCVTFDADLLLDAAGALSRGQPIDWPGFHAALLAVAHGVAQSGRPTVLLAPVGPGTLESIRRAS